MAESPSRWSALLRDSPEPIFLLNERRRLLFANSAWERLTGLMLADVRGRTCKRLRHPEDCEPWQVILSALVPPAEVLEGRPGSMRRRVTGGWWDIAFFPLRTTDGALGVVGKITASATGEVAGEWPFPEKIVNLRRQFAGRFELAQMISQMPVLVQAKQQARLAAQTDVPVSIVGPAGAGKHWLARAIHQAGPRRERTFVRLDCRKLPGGVLTRMLFGSDAGTIYLREPAHLPAELQVRLGDWLAEVAPTKPRVLAGMTTGDGEGPREMAPELRCRLGTLTIALPSLRERLADLEWLLPALLARASDAMGRPVTSLHAEALQLFRAHTWPGNLRELYEALVSACARAKEGRIDPGDLPFYLQNGPETPDRTLPLDTLLEQVEKRLIALALRLGHNNKTRAAELLGIWRARLIRRMDSLGLNAGDASSLTRSVSEGEP